jgi:hypothetical protein
MLPFPINHRWDNQRIESGILLFIAAANTAQSSWQEKNSDYWSKYRASHPDYVEHNRENQRERNHRRRRQDTDRSLVAKMDA